MAQAAGLADARTSGTYEGGAPASIGSGLVMGFMSEAAAMATMLPATTPLVGGRLLSDLLGGGTGACGTMIPDDRDFGPDGVTRGWYFYINYTAVETPFAP